MEFIEPSDNLYYYHSLLIIGCFPKYTKLLYFKSKTKRSALIFNQISTFFSFHFYLHCSQNHCGCYKTEMSSAGSLIQNIQFSLMMCCYSLGTPILCCHNLSINGSKSNILPPCMDEAVVADLLLSLHKKL